MQLYRINEVAGKLGVAKSTVWLYLKQGRLKATKLSQRVTTISSDELERFIAEAAGGAK